MPKKDTQIQTKSATIREPFSNTRTSHRLAYTRVGGRFVFLVSLRGMQMISRMLFVQPRRIDMKAKMKTLVCQTFLQK